MKTDNPVFDYRLLRFTVGFIALALPILVVVFAQIALSSISASYHSSARDVFVGLMFVVGALLFTYNGHTVTQAAISKVAALAAIAVALCPIACDGCETNVSSILHYGAAAILFGILAWFCLGPFREHTKGKDGKKGLRSKIYLICGVTIIISMALAVLLPDQLLREYNLVFWAEAIALGAFGIAWIVSGKVIPFLVDESQRLKIL